MRTKSNSVRAFSGARLADTIDKKAPNGESYDHRFIASTDRLASDRGVILVDAWHVDGWMQRPRWIANHDIGGAAKLTDVTLGRGVWAGIEHGLDKARVGPSGRALVVYVKYASTPFAQEVRTLYEEGGLDDVSVRWDPRSEVIRDPTPDELQLYGDDLAWVCTRADLVELSAVALGADPGAQQLRGVEAALERVRTSTGRRLPLIEQMLGRADELPDTMAAAEVIDFAKMAVLAIAEWRDNIGPFRHQLGDAGTLLTNLVAAAKPDMEADENPGDTETDAQAALTDYYDAVTGLDVALRAVTAGITGLRSAVTQIAEASGVPLEWDQRQLVIDVAAILAEQEADHGTLRFDLPAILRDSERR